MALEGSLVSASAPLMGGTVSVHLRPGDPSATAREGASRDASRALARLRPWAARLTRFSPTSDLSVLNADPRTIVPIRPTLAALLGWSQAAGAATDGLVDITLLDERLRAEDRVGGTGEPPVPRRSPRSWTLEPQGRGALVRRSAGLRFDLDGVGKGWLADRALDMLIQHRAALVDADGDIAVSLRPGERWYIGVDDGRAPSGAEADLLATLELVGREGPSATRIGVATSGTSVHRWASDGVVWHHLIDPATGEPARTDLVQATVLAETARVAEAYAKTAVIAGSDGALRLLDRPGILGALLLTDRGDLVALPVTQRWLI